MKQNSKNRGFSVIELVLVIGIIAVIAAFTLPNLFSRKSATELNNTANQMSVTLREAQSRAISQSGGTDWGVRFDNGNPPYFAMFSTPNYDPSTRVIYTTLPPGIGYVTSTLAASNYKDVVFNQITGKPDASLYLDLYLVKNPQITLAVSVSTSGQVAVLTKEILLASLAASVQNVVELAQAAQQNSKDQVNNAVWGVHFENPTNATPYAELFYGTYSLGTVTERFDLLPGVDYDTASIAEGGFLNVTFDSDGTPSQEVIITMELISNPTITSGVTIREGCIGEIITCFSIE